MDNKQLVKTPFKQAISPFFSIFEKSTNIVAKVLLLFSLGFCLLSVLFLWEHNFQIAIKVCGVILFAFLVIFAYLISANINSDKTAIVLLLGISLILLGGWNLICDVKPVNDYEVLVEGANAIIDGEFPLMAKEKDNYFYFYNFQIGYAFYLSILLRLFGGSLVALKIIEIIVITITNIVVYKIMRLFFTCKESFFAAVLMVINPYIFMGSGILNNQHISCLLCLIAIYIYLSAKKFVKYVFCGMLLAVAQTLRPTTTVIFIAFVLCSLLYGVFKKEKQLLLGALTILATYFVTFNLINLFFIISDLAPIGIKNSNPYFKLLLGLTGNGITGRPSTDARHTQFYYDLMAFNFDYEAYKVAAKEYLKACFVENKISYQWIIKKMVYFSGDVDNQYGFANEVFNANHSFLVGVLNVVGTLLYFISILFSFIQSIIENNVVKNKAYMLWVLIFGLLFFAYVFLETQPRYRYEQYYMLFFLSMPLFYKTIQKIHIKLNSVKICPD